MTEAGLPDDQVAQVPDDQVVEMAGRIREKIRSKYPNLPL
jgi:hypothetical protein